MRAAAQSRASQILGRIIFLCIGSAFLVGALVSAHRTQLFLRSCVTTQGWIVGLKPVHSARNGSITYAPAFRFNVPGTHFSTVVSRTSSNPPAFKWGERVTVRYPAGHPEQAVIDSFGQLWLRVWAFGGFGAVFCGTALLPPIFSMLRKPRDLPSPNPNSDGAVGIIRRG
jgi:hypothetical protein